MSAVLYIEAMTEETARRVSFGEAVRHRRKLLGLKQGEVARKLGVSQNTVSRWEIAARPPDDYWLTQLAALLRADPEELRQGIIRLEAEDDAVRAEIERIAVGHADTPEDVGLLTTVMERALSLDPEGLRRAEDYLRLLVEHYGRRKEDDDEDAAEDELKVKGS